jgi:hypothetical protein
MANVADDVRRCGGCGRELPATCSAEAGLVDGADRVRLLHRSGDHRTRPNATAAPAARCASAHTNDKATPHAGHASSTCP